MYLKAFPLKKIKHDPNNESNKKSQPRRKIFTHS
jgi:hypothetical protein